MSDGNDSDAAAHPIRVAAARAGLTPATLRAWERRYGVIEPTRSGSGRRLYTGAEVRRLTLLREVVEQGHLISAVAGKNDDELKELLSRRERAGRDSALTDHAAAGDHLSKAMAAVGSLQVDRLDKVLRVACLELGSVGVVVSVVEPLLAWIGESWRHGGEGVATEHAASVTVRRFLDWLLGSLGGTEGRPVFAVATPTGERHEFGALMAGVVAATGGFGVAYLGPDLPVDEIARGAEEVRAGTVGVSTVLPRERKEMRQQAQLLRDLLPSSKRLVWGGAAAGAVSGIPGVTTTTSLPALAEYLGGSTE